MPTLKWAGAPTVQTILTLGADLPNNSLSAFSLSSFLNNQTDLNTYLWFELLATFDTAGTWDSNPTVEVYWNRALDGTNLEDPATGGGQVQGHVISIPVVTVGTAQRLLVGPVSLPPLKMRFAVDNQTGQTLLASGMALNIGIANLASV